MDKIIGLKEFRQDVAKYADRVAKGDSFVVVKRSRPIFRVAPVDDEAGWETVLDFTKMRKGGIPIEELISRLKRLS